MHIHTLYSHSKITRHFFQMFQKTVRTNNLALLCQQCKTLNQLKQIHAHILTTQNPSVVAPLLSAAAKHQASLFFSYACSIFNHHHHHSRNTFMYNAMIRAHARSHAPAAAILCYSDMLRHDGLVCNKFTFPPLIKACVNLGRSDCVVPGRVVHAHVVKFGFDDDPFVVSGLIEYYCLIGEMGVAQMVFDESSVRDVVVWTTMIDGYGKIGDVVNARKVFDEMPERNVVSWSAMMAAYSRVSNFKNVLCLFRQMQEGGTRPNESVLVSVLTAAAHLGAAMQGLWVHSYARRYGFESNTILVTALVDMYSKCGCVEAALEVFGGITYRDARAWNAMINGFAMNGDARKSLELFDEMVADKVQPTETTFVVVLTACTHAKMVDKGVELFDQMDTLYGIKPGLQHYACVVDLLARAGMVEEAEKFIEDKMGGLGKGDANVWGALLGACRVHGNVVVGDRISKNLTDMGVADCGIHVLSYNMYKEAGWESEAKRVRHRIFDEGMKKKPGSSVIEVNGVSQEFIVGDPCPPQAQELLNMLHSFCKLVNLEDI